MNLTERLDEESRARAALEHKLSAILASQHAPSTDKSQAQDRGVCQFTAGVGVVQIWCGVRNRRYVHQSHGRDVRALRG